MTLKVTHNQYGRLDIWPFGLKIIGTPVAFDLRNVHASFGFTS